MDDLQFLQSTVRGILLPTAANEVLAQSTTQAVSTSTSILQTVSLTKEQTALIAIGVIGIPLICGTCLDEYLRKHRYFRCLRWLQKLKILEYKREKIEIPDSKMNNPLNNPTNSVVTLTPYMENFPDPPSVAVSYLIEQHHNLGPYDASSLTHVLLVNTLESKRVKAYASDPYGYTAECSFDILGDPFIEPITDHTRTSVRTATVRQVKCKNFPTESQVYITYYDKEICLGKFPLVREEHKLTKLRETTREITVRATDGSGNIAETYFIAEQHSPMCISVFYRRFSRQSSYRSVAVQQLQIENNNSTKITESCDDADTLKIQPKVETSPPTNTSYRELL